MTCDLYAKRGTALLDLRGMLMKKVTVLLGCAAAFLFVACQTSGPQPSRAGAGHGPANVTAQRLLDAEREPSQWMTYNGSYSEQHYSRLTQITRDNVKNLGLAWFADYDTNLQQQGQPLFIDGVIYVSTAWTKVYAYDAKTGKQLWQYDPKTPGQTIRKVCCGIVNRGIAAYHGKIYVATLEGRLVAIDAKTGKEAWSTQTVDPTKQYTITGAPRVAKGLVFIGTSGGEFGIRGYVGAYDADTGKEVWRFYTVPRNPAEGQENKALEMAAATWGKGNDWWAIGGGGSVWDAIVYDPKTDLLYFGTGNGSPWNQHYRDPSGGDNLFLASIVAVKASTGEYAWHYQTTPGDTWDYDAVSPMMTADITIDGKPRHVVMQPCKNGFMYVLDAKTGELLRANAFTDVNWADGVDLKTGRPRVVAGARYANSAWNLAPGVQGAHGWHSNAFSPDTGLVYIATQEAYFTMALDPTYKRALVGANNGARFNAELPGAKVGFTGYLQAWDPVAGKSVWKSESNQGPTGGALATATGLVFQGNGNGQPASVVNTNAVGVGPGAKPQLRAYDAKTGEKLWAFDVQTGILSSPITYELEGVQYVAVSVGAAVQGGDYYAPNYSRLLVFKASGTAALPPTKPYTARPLDPPPPTASADIVKLGEARYAQNCSICHGDNGNVRGANFPNLTRTPLLQAQEAFDAVVLQGVLKSRGMASFADTLTAEESQAVRAYLVKRANDLKNATAAGAPVPTQNGAGTIEPGRQ